MKRFIAILFVLIFAGALQSAVYAQTQPDSIPTFSAPMLVGVGLSVGMEEKTFQYSPALVFIPFEFLDRFQLPLTELEFYGVGFGTGYRITDKFFASFLYNYGFDNTKRIRFVVGFAY